MSTTTTPAPMPWFRMYADFLNDPKMIALAFEDQRHFIGILALKCAGALDGVPDAALLDRIVAQRLWIDHGIIRDVRRRLVAAGLISDDWQPLAWDKRQRRSDADGTAAERQRRRREKQKAGADVTDTPAVTVTEPSRVTVTEESRVTQRDCHAAVTRLDTDTEVDTETEERQPHSVSPGGDTGGEPPPKTPEQMTKDELWAAGKSILAQGGMPLAQCGTFVGALVRDYGADIVVDAVRAAVRERPADAPGYLTAACKRGSGQRRPAPPSRQQALESNNRAVAERLAAAGA